MKGSLDDRGIHRDADHFPFLFNFTTTADQPGQLTPQTVQNVIVLMGFSCVFKWPFSSIPCLQDCKSLSFINSRHILMPRENVGAISNSLVGFPHYSSLLIWQIALNIMQSIALALALRRNLPDTGMPAVFDSTFKKMFGVSPPVWVELLFVSLIILKWTSLFLANS